VAGNVSLAWDASDSPGVAGYNVYYGVASGNYTSFISAGNVLGCTVSNLATGVTYFFAATAYDANGSESDFSDEASALIIGTNNSPTVNPIANFGINENASAQTVNLSGITSGNPTQPGSLVVTATSSNPGLIPNPTVNYTSPNTTGVLFFTPAAFGFGSATITVTVKDNSNGNVTSQSFLVTVNFVNQPPTLNPLADVTINENATPQTINISGITSGAANEAQNLTVTAVSSNPALIPNPTVNYTSPNTTGTLSFTPLAFGFGSAIITVTINDNSSSANITTKSFVVTVNPVNQPPTLNPVSNVAINENAAPQIVNLSGITSGANNEIQNLTVTAVSSNPALIPNPTINYTSANTSGSLSFTPVAFSSGSATITVTVNDNAGSNNITTRSFVVTINPVNQPPTLNPLSNVALNENAPAQTVNLSGITSGATNEIQTLTVTAVSSNPGLIPNPTVNYTSANTTGSLSFTPVAFGSGSATITVTVNDNAGSNNVATQSFVVTVNPVNQPPTLNPLSNVAVNENSVAQTLNISGITSGAANEVQTLTVTAVSSNPALVPNPTVNYISANTTGTLSFTPVAFGFGSATITVTVNDNAASNNVITQSFVVTINPVNQPPTLNPLSNVAISENVSAQTVNLSGITSGAANEAQTLTVTAVSSNPGLIPNPTVNYTSANTTGTLSFTPASFNSGSATITVTVNDNAGSNNATSQSFIVTVNSASQPPTLNPLADVSINENAASETINLSGITSGAANEPQTLTVAAVSSNPGLIPNPTVNYTSPNTTGTLSFTPAVFGFGSSTITVSVSDNARSNSVTYQSFVVTVNPVNQPPTLNPLANITVNENAPSQTVNLSGITSGATNEIQTLSVTAVSSNPSLIPNPTINYGSPNTTGTLSFTPARLTFGSATITVTVNDNAGSNNVTAQSFVVTVHPVNQPPTLSPLAGVTINENAAAQSVNLSGVTSGATNEVQTLTLTAVSSNPSLIPNPTINYTSPNTSGSLSFAPVTLGFGSATITVTVNDNAGSNNVTTQSFVVTVNPVNQPPTLGPLANITISANAPAQTVNLSGITSGATNEIQTLTVIAASSNPGLIPNPTVDYTSPNATGTLSFAPVAFGSGSATITVTVNDNATSNNIASQSFVVNVNPVNQPPTLNPLANITINANAAAQTVNLSGITSGAANEVQTLAVTAISSNPGLIPNPTVNYTSPNMTGTLSFTPFASGSGSATITVTVDDNTGSNNVTTQSFVVTVNPVNQPPTIDSVPNVTVYENATAQTVAFSGVTSGATNETQTLSVTAASSNPALIPKPTITYTSPNTTGTLSFTPVAFGSGFSTVTVTVNDNGSSHNLTSRSFAVLVIAINQPPTLNPLSNITLSTNAPAQTVKLSGITSGAPNEAQALTVTAVSSNPGLIPNPTVNYTSPNTTGTLSFTPVASVFGSATITVTVNDHGGTNSVVSRAFIVSVKRSNAPLAPTSLRLLSKTK
jgi:translation elongation factor EF-1beta